LTYEPGLDPVFLSIEEAVVLKITFLPPRVILYGRCCFRMASIGSSSAE
jgi:hypothetical protein